MANVWKFRSESPDHRVILADGTEVVFVNGQYWTSDRRVAEYLLQLAAEGLLQEEGEKTPVGADVVLEESIAVEEVSESG